MDDSSQSAVLAEGLFKSFGETQALVDVDLRVDRAKVVGLLGPNGAGKTTAVRVLTTLIKPDAGRAFVDGIDVVADPQRAKARIGLTGQYAAVDERLTGFENLQHVGRLFHMRLPEARERGRELLDRFDLAEAGDRVVKGFSGGMRRRLDIAMSLIARPSVLFLDEPTTGLDPRARQSVWELIDELTRGGTTTLLTTQYLDEADRLTDEIVVIDHGRVIARGTSDALKLQVGGDVLEVSVSSSDAAQQVMSALAGLACGEILIDREENGPLRTVRVPVVKVSGMTPNAVRQLDAANIPFVDVVGRQSTLDDVFFALTGHGAAEEVPDVALVDGKRTKAKASKRSNDRTQP
ncbi:MAG: ATP-binding cassette domain-containing protein [Acidimicrobiales bacterium]